MARAKAERVESGLILCRGGRSFNCARVMDSANEKDSRALGPHEAKAPVYCRRCKLYMGCFWCAQCPAELACLNCRDWATDEAEREHGRIVPRDSTAIRVRELAAGV